MDLTVAAHEKKQIFKLMDQIYQVQVIGFDGKMKVIDLCDSEEMMKKMTVLQLRSKVLEKFPGNAGRINTEKEKQ